MQVSLPSVPNFLCVVNTALSSKVRHQLEGHLKVSTRFLIAERQHPQIQKVLDTFCFTPENNCSFSPWFLPVPGSSQGLTSHLSQNLSIDSAAAGHMLSSNTSPSALYQLPNNVILLTTAQ